MKIYSSIIVPLIVSGLFATATLAFAQGSLTPPGAPAQTMKSLDQIEPLTPISIDSSLPHIQSLMLAQTDDGAEKGCEPSSIVSQSVAAGNGGLKFNALTKPSVVSRTSWGCPNGENSPLWSPQYTTVTHLVVHHSATANSSANWAADVLSIWNYHTYTQGWGDIGYNYLIDPNGVIYEGRAGGDNVIGAHFSCQNGGTFGVCVLGTYTSVSPTAAALSSLKQLLAWKADQRGIDPLGSTYHSGTHLTLSNICGHRDANPAYPQYACGTTDCPGDYLYGLLPSIRTDVYNLLHQNLLPDLTIAGSVTVSPTSVASGGTIRVDWTEKNQGTAASTPAHNTKIYLSSSAYGTTYQIGYFGPMNTLGVGATYSYSQPLVVTASIPAGNYYVTAFIDCDQQVSESSDNNNIGSSTPTTLTIGNTDTTSPTVSLNSPFNGQIFTSTPITVNGTATDPGSPSSGVSLVQVQDNSTSGTWQTASGTTSWSTSVTLTPGANAIYMRAQDGAGNYSVLSVVNVTYNPPVDTTPPTVSLNSPFNGQIFTSTPITVNGTATDPGSPSSGVSLVQVQDNSTSGAWQTASGTTSWSTSVTLTPGANAIYMRARDVAGNYSVLSVVNVTYNPPVDTTPPTLNLNTPNNGQVFATSPITVSGTAADPGSPSSGVSLVQVQDNSTSGTWQTASGTTSWSTSVTLTPGANAIYMRARDVAGNYSVLSVVNVTYNPPVTPPMLGTAKQNSSMVFSWPTSATGFVLQSSPNLGSSAVWSANLPSPVVVGGQNVVTNPMSGSRMFFRLMHP